ncbi:MAG: ATP-binding cassette domain-containing protein, partial [Armatimonadota bacterium]
MTVGASILRVQNLHKSFGQLEVLRSISLTVGEGEVIGLIGASGSGKSTLLRCLNRLETPTSGSVSFRGTEVTAANMNTVRREMGMVF